ncbi:MAG: hypothetical protein PSN37_04980 [Alphaproteobacteria bacterium]|nr:hypothetical protein [Alphaproteobacteria bacterium]
MFRVMNCFAVLTIIFSSFFLYHIKSEARRDAALLVTLREDIRKEQEMINVLKAEWSHLDQPRRLQDLAGRYLDLRLLDAHQIIALKDLNEF